MTEDIIGRKFNKLLVLSWAEPKLRRDGSRVKRVNCLCDCGNTKAVIPAKLRSGEVTSCGCGRLQRKRWVDLTGQKIGRLTVLKEDSLQGREVHGERFWICRCDCGNVKTVRQSSLRKADGTRSCGCLSKPPTKVLPDLIGNRYGLLTVVSKADPPPRGNWRRWYCVCDCGNKAVLKTEDLLSGQTRSCGCLNAKMRRGKRFGKLTLISAAPEKHGTRYWNCRCDCGRELTVSVDTILRASNVCCECRETPKPGVDLPGKTFGRLTALMEVDPVIATNGTRHRCWLCRCSCGKERVIREQHLVYGITRSCGCLKKERAWTSQLPLRRIQPYVAGAGSSGSSSNINGEPPQGSFSPSP